MDFTNPDINGHLRLGLCCINTLLRKRDIFCSRTCIRRTFTVERAQEKALHNIRDMIKMIEWNKKNGISCFRISSDIFPHYTDPKTEHYSLEFAKQLLKKAGDIAKAYGQRILMHPGQYNQIGAIDPDIFESTVKDLQHHADILDAMEMDDDSVVIIHGGGTYGSKSKTVDRWIKQFESLPVSIKNRLALENCERSYSVEDCLYMANKCRIPVVFDFHHYHCWKKVQKPISEIFPLILDTWKQRNRRVVMHISDQDPEKKIGAHHDYVESIPNIIFETIINTGLDIDLEIEAKMKEQAIFKLYKKYNFSTL